MNRLIARLRAVPSGKHHELAAIALCAATPAVIYLAGLLLPGEPAAANAQVPDEIGNDEVLEALVPLGDLVASMRPDAGRGYAAAELSGVDIPFAWASVADASDTESAVEEPEAVEEILFHLTGIAGGRRPAAVIDGLARSAGDPLRGGWRVGRIETASRRVVLVHPERGTRMLKLEALLGD